jgi:hypothetical protein
MASQRENLEKATLERLADDMQFGPTSAGYYPALAELERRRALWEREASEAQMAASGYAESTANYTKANARYMLFSVLATLIAAAVSAFFSFMTWQFPRH